MNTKSKLKSYKAPADAPLQIADSAPSLPMNVISKLRKGLPLSVLVELAKDLDVSLEHAAQVTGIAPRTLARRKLSRVLDPLESERVHRVARILARAKAVLGSVEKARAWLQKENRGLGAATPLSLLDTDVGARAVEDTLGRIEHGIVG